MKGLPLQERVCPSCEGKGFPPVKQQSKPGLRFFPAPCPRCGGKGRIPKGGVATREVPEVGPVRVS
jgi:DnaJ-class molecular chaperone